MLEEPLSTEVPPSGPWMGRKWMGASGRQKRQLGPGVPEGIGHGFGESGGDAAQVEEGQVKEVEVHGGVQTAVAGFGCADEAVAQESSQVDAQEEPEPSMKSICMVCSETYYVMLCE